MVNFQGCLHYKNRLCLARSSQEQAGSDVADIVKIVSNQIFAGFAGYRPSVDLHSSPFGLNAQAVNSGISAYLRSTAALSSSGGNMSGNKLNSWKEIAAYLECDESTARRHEKNSQLPVHRVGGKGASVYAYPDEVDNWLRGGRRRAEKEAATMPPLEISESLKLNPSEADSTRSTIGREPTVQSAPVAETVPARFLARWPRYSLIGTIVTVIVAVLLWTGLTGRHVPTQSFTNRQSDSFATDDASSEKMQETIGPQLKILVKQAQIWEMLTLYSAPWNCDAHDLNLYWDTGSKAFVDVGESASRLNERGWHYGFGTKLLDFQFRYVKISQDGLSATVGTREHWWLPLYTRDETPVPNRNPDQGPYEIDYSLVKMNGRWYLRSTSTPYSQWKPQRITCKNWPR